MLFFVYSVWFGSICNSAYSQRWLYHQCWFNSSLWSILRDLRLCNNKSSYRRFYERFSRSTHWKRHSSQCCCGKSMNLTKKKSHWLDFSLDQFGHHWLSLHLIKTKYRNSVRTILLNGQHNRVNLHLHLFFLPQELTHPMSPGKSSRRSSSINSLLLL